MGKLMDEHRVGTNVRWSRAMALQFLIRCYRMDNLDKPMDERQPGKQLVHWLAFLVPLVQFRATMNCHSLGILLWAERTLKFREKIAKCEFNLAIWHLPGHKAGLMLAGYCSAPNGTDTAVATTAKKKICNQNHNLLNNFH